EPFPFRWNRNGAVFDLTRFLDANRSPPPDQARGYASLENALAALVVVLDADDVVLAEIAAGLDFDQFELDLAGILQPVHRADRDVDRFVLVHGLDQFVDGHLCRSAHHDPVLGTVVMLLQREPPARLDDDAL